MHASFTVSAGADCHHDDAPQRRIWAGSELRDADKKYREEMKEAEEKVRVATAPVGPLGPIMEWHGCVMQGMAKEEFYRANVLHLFAPLYLGVGFPLR